MKKQLKSHGLKKDMFKIDDEVIYYIIRHYTREAGVRELNRYIGALIRKAIKNILIDKVPIFILPLKMLRSISVKKYLIIIS